MLTAKDSGWKFGFEKHSFAESMCYNTVVSVYFLLIGNTRRQ